MVQLSTMTYSFKSGSLAKSGFDEYIRIGESTSTKCLYGFASIVIEIFGVRVLVPWIGNIGTRTRMVKGVWSWKQL